MWRNIADRPILTKFLTYTATSEIPQNYNAVRIINAGTIDCTVGVLPLAPGASVGWSYNQFEIDQSQIYIDFPNGNAGAVVYVILTYFKDVDH